MSRRSYSGTAVPTVLTAGIGALDLTFTVQDATGYPDGTAGPFFITLARGISGEEKVLCDSRSGLTFTVNATGRGADGTVATSHAASSTTVEHTITKTDLDEANAHVNDTTGDPHPQYLTPSEGDAAYLSARSIPAGALAAGTGVPTLGVTGSFYPVWLLDSATSESVGAVIHVPDTWATVAVDAYLVNPAASTGNYVYRSISQSIAVGAAFAPGGGTSTTVAALGQDTLQKVTILTGLAAGADRSLLVGIERQGANAADTLANDIGVLGFVVRKVS